MKTFIGTKIVTAVAMTRLAYNEYRGWELPEDENGEDAGFLVEYLDGGQSNHPDHKGYISWSPVEVFERSYESVEKMCFEHAFIAAKQGRKIARAGWNGAGMFVKAVPNWTYTDGESDNYENLPLLVLKNNKEKVSSWVPSMGDLFATDWQVVG